MDWSFIDQIYIISLKEREDRYLRAKAELERLGIPLSKITFYRPTRDKEDPVRGCYESHQAVIKLALENGYKVPLILEDDVVGSDSLCSGTLEEVKFFLEDGWADKKFTYDLFYLGCVPDTLKFPTIPFWKWYCDHYHCFHKPDPSNPLSKIYKVKAWAAHAYIPSRSYMKKIALSPYNGHAIDGIYVGCNKAFAILPSLFNQGAYGTDIQSYNLDGWRESLSQINENWAVGYGAPMAFLIPLVGVLLIFIILILVCGSSYHEKLQMITLSLLFLVVTALLIR